MINYENVLNTTVGARTPHALTNPNVANVPSDDCSNVSGAKGEMVEGDARQGRHSTL